MIALPIAQNRRLRMLVLLVLVLVLSAALPALGARAATPGGSGEVSTEDVYAEVEPSVVQLGIQWTGFVGFQGNDGMVWSDELQTAGSCSGFFVSPNGHIATAGHCVDEAGGRESLINAYLDELVAKNILTDEEADAIFADAYATWKVESQAEGSPPDRTVFVGQPKAVEGAVLEDPLVAQVVDYRPAEDGDIALLKVEAGQTPPLPIAEQDPRSGAPVTAIGFPGSVADVTDPTKVRASFKSGTTSSQQISNSGVAVTEVNADMSRGMSGGPVIDRYGNALGIISFGPRGEVESFNFMTDTTDLREYLMARGLSLPSPRSAPLPNSAAAPATGAATDALRDSGRDSGGMPGWAWGLIILLAVLAAGAAAFLLMKKRTPASAQAGAGGSAPGAWVPPPGQGPSGSQALAVCPNNHTNPPGAAFCSQCGAPVSRQG